MKTADLFITDGGAVYCTRHLGHSARTTGRDISGQPVQPVTLDELQAAGLDGCETCVDADHDARREEREDLLDRLGDDARDCAPLDYEADSRGEEIRDASDDCPERWEP